MTLPRKNIYQTAETWITQVALQHNLEELAEVDETIDPEVVALLESAIAEQLAIIEGDKFYEC